MRNRLARIGIDIFSFHDANKSIEYFEKKKKIAYGNCFFFVNTSYFLKATQIILIYIQICRYVFVHANLLGLVDNFF